MRAVRHETDTVVMLSVIVRKENVPEYMLSEYSMIESADLSLPRMVLNKVGLESYYQGNHLRPSTKSEVHVSLESIEATVKMPAHPQEKGSAARVPPLPLVRPVHLFHGMAEAHEFLASLALNGQGGLA